MIRSIAADRERRVFSNDQYDAFIAFIEKVKSNTMVLPVDSVEQLLLDKEFKTVGDNLVFTQTALRQCCNFLSKNLYGLIKDLTLPSAVLHVFNTVLKIKFERLKGKRIIKNVATNRIEAVVTCVHSDTTRLFPNVFKSNKFLKASVTDNRIIKTVFSVPSDTSTSLANCFIFSIYLLPSGLIRLSCFIKTSDLKDVKLKVSSVKLHAADKDFSDKFSKAVNKLSTEANELKEKLPQLQTNLESINLGLTGDGKKDERQIIFLSKSLTRLFKHVSTEGRHKKIKESTVRKAILKALHSDSIGSSVSSFEQARVEKLSSWSNKTMLDLFYATLVVCPDWRVFLSAFGSPRKEER